jgi:hypothetical protein
MLSQEKSQNEINWSLGHYMTVDEVEKAFDVSDLPKPYSVAPNQPFTGAFYYTWGALPLFLLIIVAVFMIPLSGGFGSTVLAEEIILSPQTSQTAPQTVFTQPFELKGNRNVRITAIAPNVNNEWVALEADLVNEANNEVDSIPINIEYYTGTDSDGSWTEGSKNEDATMSSLPGGKYVLRLQGTWQKWQEPQPLRVKIEQNVVRGINFICAFIVLAIIPILAFFRKFAFESKRWSESMFGNTT